MLGVLKAALLGLVTATFEFIGNIIHVGSIFR
jgi:hypothetical protein